MILASSWYSAMFVDLTVCAVVVLALTQVHFTGAKILFPFRRALSCSNRTLFQSEKTCM